MSLAESGLKKIIVQAINYCQNCTLEIRTVGITTTQTYDRINDVFVPDYTDEACRLQIFPRCTLVNPDSPIASTSINAQLLKENFSWEEVTPSGVTKIYPINTTSGVKEGYEVTTSGDNAGEIVVKSNGSIGVKRTLRFKAKWYDSQSGHCYVFQADKGLDVVNATEALPELVVSSPRTFLWNPFRNVSTYEVKASVFVGKKDMVEDARCKLWWYRLLENDSKQLITSGDTLNDLDVKTLKTGKNGQITSITFDLDMMGEGSSYEVRAAFRSSGSLPAEPENDDPIYQFTMARRFPKITASINGGIINVTNGIPTIELSAIIKDNMDIIPDWNRYASYSHCSDW